ncbi:MAG: glycoside hydrolase family 18 [Bacteroidales bacterium]|nr:glycoside hydrolase family 18 [Bacteroidales bacterium]
MKIFKKLLYIVPAAGVAMSSVSCTDVEKIEVEHIGGYNTMDNEQSREYYENLRAYKDEIWNYGRPVAFGWFSDWAPQGAARKGYLSAIPDSMDIVSMWSGAPGRFEITPEQKRDKEFVQKVKGTKLLEVSLLSYLGKGRTPESIYTPLYKQAEEEGWSQSKLDSEKDIARWAYWGIAPEDLNNLEKMKEAHSRFAKALCDSLFTNEWDGFDIDWEPGSGFNDADGTLAGNRYQTELIVHLVKEMGKYIGPMSDPDGKGHKLLCIDGIMSTFQSQCPEYVDYFIEQSYGYTRPISFNRPEKVILTENFEQYAVSGGSIMGHARYMPSNGYKGGFGAYRFTKDYDNTPDYKWMRKGIQENLRVFNEWKAAQAETPNPEQ